MLYAAFVFWALVAIFAARAVYDLLARGIPAKVLNYLLLPGTLVAQVGHHIALLVTGATISQSKLANESTGEPELQADAKSKIPVIGPIVIGVLPIFMCGAALYWTAEWLSARGMIGEITSLPKHLPKDLDAFWHLARTMIDMLQGAAAAWTNARWNQWQTWLFAYLTVCLMVRLSPLSRDIRPALFGVALFGVVGWFISYFTNWTWPAEKLARFWTNWSFLVANLLLLLLVSLIVAGFMGLYAIIKGQSGSPGGGGKAGGKPSAKAG